MCDATLVRGLNNPLAGVAPIATRATLARGLFNTQTNAPAAFGDFIVWFGMFRFDPVFPIGSSLVPWLLGSLVPRRAS